MKSRLTIMGSPVHPVLVHMPIALYMASLFFDAVTVWRGGAFSARAAFWLIALGLIGQVGAMASGLPDYLAIAKDQMSPAFRIVRLHALLGLGLFVLYLLNLATRIEGVTFIAIVMNLIGNGLLGLQGRYGGELVYRHGIGVDRSP